MKRTRGYVIRLDMTLMGYFIKIFSSETGKGIIKGVREDAKVYGTIEEAKDQLDFLNKFTARIELDHFNFCEVDIEEVEIYDTRELMKPIPL